MRSLSGPLPEARGLPFAGRFGPWVGVAASAAAFTVVPCQLLSVGFANAPVATQPPLASIAVGLSKLAMMLLASRPAASMVTLVVTWQVGQDVTVIARDRVVGVV